MTKSGAQNRPAGSSTADELVNTVDLMAKVTENQHTTDTQTTTENQDSTTGKISPQTYRRPEATRTTAKPFRTSGAPELRNAVIELLTIIDDSDDMDVVVTISDDGMSSSRLPSPTSTGESDDTGTSGSARRHIGRRRRRANRTGTAPRSVTRCGSHDRDHLAASRPDSSPAVPAWSRRKLPGRPRGRRRVRR